MKLSKVECPSCGARLDYQDDEMQVTCNSCGSVFHVNKSLEDIIVSAISPRTQPSSEINFEKTIAFKYERTIEQVKQDWLNLLLQDENAPVDVACMSNITEIKKEYYPFAVFDVVCEGEWQATSIWEHTESYQVPRDITVYIDQYGDEHKSPGQDAIVKNGNVYHSSWRPMNKTVYDTKHKTVTDNIERTSGHSGPVRFSQRVWLGDDESRSRLFNWTSNLSTDSCERLDSNQINDSEIIAESVGRNDAKTIAIESAKADMNSFAANEVPGTRYEDFEFSGEILDVTRTTYLFGIYHITYEYNGTPFECWISGGAVADNDFTNHPIDESLKTRTEEIKKEAKKSSFASRKTLFLLGFPFLYFVTLCLLVFTSVPRISVACAIFGIIFAIGAGYCLARFIMMQRENADIHVYKNEYAKNNANMRNSIANIIKDDSCSEAEKRATIKAWISEHSAELENYETKLRSIKKKSAKLGVIVAASITAGIVGLIMIVKVWPILSLAIDDAKPAKAISEDDYDVGDEIEFGSYKSEPIEWIVLDKTDGRVLVISKDALFDYDDRVQYDDWPKDVTSWASSDIRKHLNSDEFLDSIFTESEQKAILETKLTTAANPYYGTPGGKDTKDKLFLPSAYDVVYYFKTNKDARCHWITDGKECAYWLRTPGEVASQVVYVAADGSIDFEGDSSTEYTVFNPLENASDMYVIVSARPMMWLMLDTYDEDDHDDDVKYGDSDLNWSNDSSEGTSNRSKPDSASNGNSDSNSNQILYKKQAFMDLAFEIPRDAKVTEGNAQNALGQITIGLPSDSTAIQVVAIDLADYYVSASNEAEVDSTMLTSFLKSNNGTNIEYFEEYIDGKIAEGAQCQTNVGGNTYSTMVYVFCNKDYSKMYLITIDVYNSGNISDDDALILAHFIDTIRIG